MEPWDAIRARRNLRSYTADPMPDDSFTQELVDRVRAVLTLPH
jgi:hypothetical protein